ncbi:hypothetical protein CIG19_05960 [Enterobacterales bacterium CwR94]|nr:hypothetical protein CIG19_05960 [Enterobacterales bacterium CwR94]
MLAKRLESGWAILLPGVGMTLLSLLDLSMTQWRALVVIALLSTVLMLFHQRLRHFMLLPSCVALAGGMTAIALNFYTA